MNKIPESALHGYQKDAVQFILHNPYCAVFLECGLGKTVTTLTAITLLKLVGDVNKVLIIAPLRVAQTVWAEESAKWEHTDGLKIVKVLGTQNARLRALQQEGDIYVINAENIPWLMNSLGKRWPFDTVVFDEFSLFKNSKSKRFKAAKVFRKQVKRVIGLTGTPVPNGIHDLWSQLFLLDQGERLFNTLTKYRDKYFDVDYFGYTYTPKTGASKAVQDKIKDICLSMRAKDYLDMPKIIENTIQVEIPKKAMTQYARIRKELTLELDQSRVDVANAAVLVGKSLQLSNGALYTDEQRNYEVLHTAKLDALADIVEESVGEPILVFYQFAFDLIEIQKRIPSAVLLDQSILPEWDKGNIPVMLAHPASAGHGLNLQKGGHILVWFGLNYNLEQFEQANGRLYRQGQTKPVIIHYLLAANTLDEVVLDCLKGKFETQKALMDAVKFKITET